MAHLFAVALALRNPHGLGRRLATLYTYAQPRIGDKKFVAESDRLLHKCAATCNRICCACMHAIADEPISRPHCHPCLV